jgi:regulator of RNase E activity RraA
MARILGQAARHTVVRPGDRIYADRNAVMVSHEKLDLTAVAAVQAPR